MVSQREKSAFGLRLPGPAHAELRHIKGGDAPRAQGHKAWNATWLLIDFLQRHPPPTARRVLDVGCGWGLGGIYCARALAAEVLALDIDARVFPYLHLHARLNEVEIATRQLDIADVDAEILSAQDLLVGADICFRNEMVAPVCQLVERAVTTGVPRLLLADPGRPSFRHLCTHCSEHLQAQVLDWSTTEPLIDWPGQRPQIRGQLLLVGSWDLPPTPSPA